MGAHEAEHVPSPPPRAADLVSLWLLTALLFCVGGFFASVQAGVTSIAVAAGSEGAAGLVYGAMGVTSAIAGLLTAALPRPVRAAQPDRGVPAAAAAVRPAARRDRRQRPSVAGRCAALSSSRVRRRPDADHGADDRGAHGRRCRGVLGHDSHGVRVVPVTRQPALLGGLLAQEHGAIGAFTVTLVAVSCAVVLAVVARPACGGSPGPVAPPSVEVVEA